MAGFAMVEEALLLARLCAAYEFNPVAENIPQPVAHRKRFIDTAAYAA
ncbi:hypothetical protein [uncultured Planktomarina sp.]